MAAPLILVEVHPRRVADGVAETVRLAGGGSRPFHHDGQHWRAGIEALPTIMASIDYDGEIVGGGVAQAMTLSFAPSSHSIIDALSGYFWADAAITVRIGPEGSLPPVVASGKVLDVAISEGKMAIALADPAVDLMKPLPLAKYAGTGGLEGPEEWEGLVKRRVWGRLFNLQAQPMDKANNVFCLADPMHRLLAIAAVRDRGAAAAELTYLDWQGTVEATLTALQAAVAPAGGGVVCPSIACLKWWTEPAGDLHCDVLGEVGPDDMGGYVETTADIAERIVQALGGPAFAPGVVAASAALRSAPMGWIVADDTTTVAAMLDDMMASVSLLWLLSATGEILIRPWAWGASVASAISQDVTRQNMLRPVTTRRLGYQRNETVMARGDLAAIVLASDVTYPDGTVVSDVQPAEAGATAGAPAGTQVDTIAAEDVSATIAPGGGVAADQVGTAAIVAGSVTGAYHAVSSAAIAGDGSWRTLVSYPVEMAEAGDILLWADASQTFGDGARAWDYRIMVGSTALNLVAGDVVQAATALSGRLAVGAGSVTVALQARAADSTVAVAAGRASLLALRCYR